MANEINVVIKRAEADVKMFKKLTKAAYVDVLEHALAGDAFSVPMAYVQALNIRAHFTRRGMRGQMHQRKQSDQIVMVTFNAKQ